MIILIEQFEIKDLNSENLILQENLASREERKEYIRYNLVKSGFTEVINFPFTQNKDLTLLNLIIL